MEWIANHKRAGRKSRKKQITTKVVNKIVHHRKRATLMDLVKLLKIKRHHTRWRKRNQLNRVRNKNQDIQVKSRKVSISIRARRVKKVSRSLKKRLKTRKSRNYQTRRVKSRFQTE